MARAIVELLVGGLVWVLGIIVVFLVIDTSDRERPPGGRTVPEKAEPRRYKESARDLAGDYEYFLSHGNSLRRYLVHVPKGADRSRKLPVVLAFHGGGGGAEGGGPEGFRAASRLNDAADRSGFLVVYPEGSGVSRVLSFNAGSCCGQAVRDRVDDVGFVRQLLDELPKKYAVDSRRVYATGFGNGAMLCYRLACELPDRIAAIAPVSGDMGVDGPKPARPVPVLDFHGMQDPDTLFEGGKGKGQAVAHRSAAESLAFWIKWNNCRPKPAEEKTKDYVRSEWSPASSEGAPVILYALPGGGHTWPGGVNTAPQLNLGPLVPSVDATTIIWKFFDRFSLPEPAKGG